MAEKYQFYSSQAQALHEKKKGISQQTTVDVYLVHVECKVESE